MDTKYFTIAFILNDNDATLTSDTLTVCERVVGIATDKQNTKNSC